MAVGDIVGALTAVGGAATSFVLINNPGGFFAISGSNLIEAVNTPDGIYPITIKAIGPGYQATTSFSLDFTGGQPIPPVGTFFIGLNLSGLENSSPTPPSFASVNYLVNNGFINFRLPTRWENFQSAIGGPLNPTYVATLHTALALFAGLGAQATIDLHNFGFGPGSNVMPASDAMAAAPWVTSSNGVALPVRTANAILNPFGTLTATQIVLPAVSGAGNYSVVAIPIALTTASTMTWSVYLKGAVGGESLYIMTTTDGVSYLRQHCTLTTAWQRFSFTGTSTVSANNFFQIGTDLRDGSQSATLAQTIYASSGQLEFGSSPTTYAAQGSYAVGSPQLPISAYIQLWNSIIQEFGSSAGLYAIDLMNEWVNGFDSATAQSAQQQVITSVRGAPYNYTGFIYCEGVNFSGTWNWVSGEGQSFNNTGMIFSDPLNRTKIEGHCYFDRDNSGSHFSYAIESTTPGSAPPGVNTNPTIAVTRLTPFFQWLSQNNQVGNWGEGGTSSDAYAKGGNLNYPAWNLILDNGIAFAQTNNVEYWYWGAGSGFGAGFLSVNPGYGFNPEPFSFVDLTTKDYSATGVQAPQMVVLRRYAGNVGAQPTAYALTYPMSVTPTGNPEAPSVARVLYSSVGVASAPFTIYYGGLIASTVTITPHAKLVDGTSAGGTFTPSSIILATGENALATFTYTPIQQTTLVISTTNNAGWTDPPALGFSSVADPYSTLDYTKLTNVSGMYNRFTPNIGPSLRLQRLTDNQPMDWFMTLPNSAGQLGFDRTAIQTWASQRSGIPIIDWYDASGNNNVTAFSGSILPTLNLNNSAGYPEIVVASGVRGESNTPINGPNGLGQPLFSAIARYNQTTTTGGLFRMDQFLGPFVFGNAGGANFTVFNAPVNGAVIANVSLGLVTGAYHEYGVSYASGVTNGITTYRDSTQIAQTTATYSMLAAFNHTQFEFAWFSSGSSPWVGSVTNYEIFEGLALTPTQVAAINTMDATYYSTALPDTLPAIPPTIVAGGIPGNVFDVVPNSPFSGVSIIDQNSGSPTDTLVLTLSGAAATLTGTGITGTNPYTIAAASAASVTATLMALSLNTTATPGLTVTVNIAATSSAGSSSSTNMVLTVQAYQAETPFTPPVGTFTPVSATPQASKGYNFSGMENGTRSNALIFGPSPYMIDYLAGKGFSNFRLPHTSKWTYPTAFGLLDTAFMAATKSIVDYAFTKNIYVILDPHDGGRIWDSAANNFALVSSADPRSSALFADYWRRLSTLFKNYPNVIFGLNNEPASQTAVQWRDGGVIPAIAAIRAIGANQLITIPGTSFTGAWTWQLSGSAAAFAGFNSDPANNFVFEMHQYLDTGGAQGTGSGSSPIAGLNGSTQLDTSPNGLATTWLIANGFQAVLYEFGIAPDPYQSIPNTNLTFNSSASPNATGSITQNGNMLAYMQANSAQWPGWSAWSGGYNFGSLPNSGSGYGYNPEPTRNPGINTGYVIPTIDQQQMGLLTSFLP